jgi:hypothetical protein
LADPTLVVVGDHKSTTDFKWAKSEDELRNNTQSVLYAAEAMNRFGVEHAELRWVYYRTRSTPASKLVRLHVTRDEVATNMERIDGLATEIQQAYKTFEKAEEAPINARACDTFGGCPYADRCNLTAKDRMKSIMAHEKSIMERMKERATQKQIEENKVQPPPDAEPAKPVEQKPAPVAAATVAAAAPATAKTGSSLAEKLAARKGVNPPPVEETSPSPVAAPPELPPTAAALDAGEAQVPGDSSQAEPPKPRRGRPPKSVASDAPPVVASVAVPPASSSEDAVDEAFLKLSEAVKAFRKLGMSLKTEVY